MTAAELQCIRERRADRRKYITECAGTFDEGEQITVDALNEADHDLDALLAEVERLGAKTVCVDCGVIGHSYCGAEMMNGEPFSDGHLALYREYGSGMAQRFIATIDRERAEVERLLAADEVRARDISRLIEERDAARVEVARRWTPGAWWRAIDTNGRLQAEASDGDEVREIARRTSSRLQRLWVTTTDHEWRDAE